MVDLSVILPAYNEARVIAASLQRLTTYLDDAGSRAGWRDWEIVVVDDGSADGSGDMARAIADRDARVRVVRLPANRGKGAAVAAGIAAARGSRLVVTDVDLSYALEDLAAAAAALEDGAGFDMVAGDRRHPSSRMDVALSALWHLVRRQTVSALFNVVVRVTYGLASRDTQCGLKAFRSEAARAVADRLRTRGFLADIEMFIIAAQLGLRIASVPVHLTCLSDASTVRVARHLPRVLADAIRIKKAQVSGAYGSPAAGTR